MQFLPHLFYKALSFSSHFVNIPTEHQGIILHSKKSILISNGEQWTKQHDSNFDVTIGSYDGAETCQLIGIYLLNLLTTEINLECHLGLYRDNGLIVCEVTPRHIEQNKKQIRNIFRKFNLSITIEANKKVVNFLDVKSFNLTNQSYKPFTKPGNTILYVHKQSDHPPTVLKNLPGNINKRLSSLSSNEEEFNTTIQPYQEALSNSGYDYKLKYNPTPKSKNKNKNRNRNILWYNPPFSSTVKTKIGKKFLQIIDKCFPPSNQLSKIFNRKTIKISYSCMPATWKILLMARTITNLKPHTPLLLLLN